MKLQPSDLKKYSREQYLEAFQYVKNRMVESKTSLVQQDVRDIITGIRFFRRKYALSMHHISDIREMTSRIQDVSEDFMDIGIMSGLQKELQKEAPKDSLYTDDIVDLFHASPLTYLVWDNDMTGSIRNVSPNMFPNFGYRSEDFLSGVINFWDIIPNQDRGRIQEEMHENILVNKLPYFEQHYRILDAEKNIRHIYSKMEVVYDAGGNISKLYGFIMDVTGKERAEQLKGDYMKALDNSAVVQIIDKNGIIQYVNDLYKKISGDKRNLVGKKANIMGGRKYHSSEFWEDLWNTIQSGQVWKGVIQNPRMDVDGSFYAQTTITPLVDEKGEYSQFIAIKFDVTEIKRMKKIIADSKDRLEKILNSTSQGFWVINEDLQILDINDAFATMLGYEKSEIIGKTIYDFFDSENRKILERQVCTIGTTNHRTYDVKFRRKDGINLPVMLQAATIRNEQGDIIEIVAFITDVSDMHEASKKDALTGIYNRGSFDHELKRCFAQIEEAELQTTSIAIFDIDHFKRVNDQYGHTVGDTVLRKIGSMLRSISSEQLSVFRYGGEEFILVGRNMDIATMEKTMEDFRKMVEDTEICTEKGGIYITISGGITAHTSGEVSNDTPEMLLESADGCLYKAKQSGRNCIQVEMRKVGRIAP